MKPTQEQVLQWAMECGFELDCCSLEWHERIKRFAALAYEAGRKDENEACAKVCELEEDNFLRDEEPSRANGAGWCASAIRARREQ